MAPLTMGAVFLEGVRRVNRAPIILAVLWIAILIVSLPLTLAMRQTLGGHLGGSLEAESAADGVNFDWMQEFAGQASGFAQTFTPAVIGRAAVAENLSSFLDNRSRPVLITAAGLAYLGTWIFLSGGIIDRFARDRPTRAVGFLWASSVFFLRFARLAVVGLIAYGVLFGPVHSWLFEGLFTRWTDDVGSERTVFAIRALLYVLFGAALAACNLLFDYAKVRAVVEDRRSMLGAVASAARFILRNPGGAIGLYLADVVLFGAVVGLYVLIAPGANTTWAGFAIGQIYVLARLWVKLVFWATETAFFQSRLAHAGYVAAAAPPWPESATAEQTAFVRPPGS